jgi:hypothetical protein
MKKKRMAERAPGGDRRPRQGAYIIISMSEARDAGRVAKAQRIAAGRWCRVDETRDTSPKDMILHHRVRAAAAEKWSATEHNYYARLGNSSGC